MHKNHTQSRKNYDRNKNHDPAKHMDQFDHMGIKGINQQFIVDIKEKLVLKE